MNSSSSDRCQFTWPENHGNSDFVRQQNCCYRETIDGSNRCIWHAPSEGVGKKTTERLEQACAPPEIRELNSPYAELLDGAKLNNTNLNDVKFLRNTSLRNADLSDCRLFRIDLSEARLFRANLTNASLISADLIGTFLEEAQLAGAQLSEANLTNSHLDITKISDVSLRGADLTNASLQEAVLEEVDLYNATLTGANIRYIKIRDVRVNRGTTFARQTRAEKDAQSVSDWDTIAQAYHELKSVFIEHGFVEKARDLHVYERRARGLESKAASTRFNGWLNPSYLSSILSRFLTGYGVRIRYLALWMILLFLSSTLWYVSAGVEGTLIGNISYSVITFTTSPPHVPSSFLTQIVAMIETFFGTLMTVLFGYVLGNRELV